MKPALLVLLQLSCAAAAAMFLKTETFSSEADCNAGINQSKYPAYYAASDTVADQICWPNGASVSAIYTFNGTGASTTWSMEGFAGSGNCTGSAGGYSNTKSGSAFEANGIPANGSCYWMRCNDGWCQEEINPNDQAVAANAWAKFTIVSSWPTSDIVPVGNNATVYSDTNCTTVTQTMAHAKDECRLDQQGFRKKDYVQFVGDGLLVVQYKLRYEDDETCEKLASVAPVGGNPLVRGDGSCAVHPMNAAMSYKMVMYGFPPTSSPTSSPTSPTATPTSSPTAATLGTLGTSEGSTTQTCYTTLASLCLGVIVVAFAEVL